MNREWAREVAAAMAATGKAIGSDVWPGVVVDLGERWRVSLARSARAYKLQVRQERSWRTMAEGETMSLMLRQWLWFAFGEVAGEVLDLDLSECPDLPEFDDLGYAHVIVADRLGVSLSPGGSRAYWLRPDYPGVVAQDDNLRVVVDRTGRLYAVQWYPPRVWETLPEGGEPEAWETQVTGATLSDLWGLVAKIRDWGGDRDARFAALVADLPEAAADGPWLVLPEGKSWAKIKRSRKRERA